MSGGFSLADTVFWGSNGAIEAYVEAMATQADRLFGPADPLARFLREELDGAFMGKIYRLDGLVLDETSRARLIRLLDAATDRVLDEDRFTRFGVAWAAAEITALRACIADQPGLSSRPAHAPHPSPVGKAADDRASPMTAPVLHPDIHNVFASVFDADSIDWTVPDTLVSRKSFAATQLVNSGGDLSEIRSQIGRLLAGDRPLLQALDRTCNGDWDDEPVTRDALRIILQEMANALDFRMRAETVSRDRVDGSVDGAA